MREMRLRAHGAVARCGILMRCVAVLLFATKARSQIAGTGNYSGNRHRRNRGRRPERIRDTHQSVNACDALWCYGTTIAETS